MTGNSSADEYIFALDIFHAGKFQLRIGDSVLQMLIESGGTCNIIAEHP